MRPRSSKSMTVAGIQRKHAIQDFFSRTQLPARAQAVGGSGKKLPGFRLLVEPDVNFGQPGAHGHVFRVHFQRLLENPHRLFQFAGAQKFFRHLQILCPGIVKEALLGVKLSQAKHDLQGGLQLGELLVHGDGFDGETLSRIGIADTLERLDRLVALAETGVEVANSIGDGEFLGVSLQDLFVLSNGILQFALLDELLRSAESFLFVEAETERHMIADSRSGLPPARKRLPWEGLPTGWPSDRPCLPIIPGMVFRTRVIVRRVTKNRMVTKGYRKGVYDRVTSGTSPVTPVEQAFSIGGSRPVHLKLVRLCSLSRFGFHLPSLCQSVDSCRILSGKNRRAGKARCERYLRFATVAADLHGK